MALVENTGTDLRTEIDQVFELQKEHISEIKHRIKKHEQFLANYAKEHPIAVDHVHFTDHTDIREQFERFRDLYAEMKYDFNRFAVKWM